MNAPLIISTMGLAGGQGKTTIALFLARYYARQGKKVLCIDADPQSSLTSFLGVKVSSQINSLLEVLVEDNFNIANAIATVNNTTYKEKEVDNSRLFLIPSDDGLEKANYELAGSGISLFALRRKVEAIAHKFDVIIIDPPPERSHLAQTAMGAADYFILPCECNVKGLQSLSRTLELIQKFSSSMSGKILGYVPFRARWVGNTPTIMTRSSMTAMSQILGEEYALPHILESDIYKNAINSRVSLADMGHEDMEFCFKEITLALEGKKKND